MASKTITALIIASIFLVGFVKEPEASVCNTQSEPSVIGKWHMAHALEDTLVFQQDGKMLFGQGGDLKEGGSWALSEDRKSISMEETSGRKNTAGITTLTADMMILDERRGPRYLLRPETLSAELQESLILGEWVYEREGITYQFLKDGIFRMLERGRTITAYDATWQLNKEDRTITYKVSSSANAQMQKIEILAFSAEVMSVKERGTAVALVKIVKEPEASICSIQSEPSVIGKWQMAHAVEYTLVFQQDGKMLLGRGDAPKEIGSWTLSADGKSINTEETSGGKKIYEITTLTADTMVLDGELYLLRPETFSAELQESLILGEWVYEREGITYQFLKDGIFRMLERGRTITAYDATWQLNKEDRTITYKVSSSANAQMQKIEILAFSAEVMSVKERGTAVALVKTVKEPEASVSNTQSEPSVTGKWQMAHAVEDTLVFQQDGKMLLGRGDAPKEIGSWTLSADGKSINTEETSGGKKIYEITTLTADTMVLDEKMYLLRPETFSAELQESLILGEWVYEREGITYQFLKDGIFRMLERGRTITAYDATWQLNKEDRTITYKVSSSANAQMQKIEILAFSAEVMSVKERGTAVALVKTD